jgi:hypothetical protein
MMMLMMMVMMMMTWHALRCVLMRVCAVASDHSRASYPSRTPPCRCSCWASVQKKTKWVKGAAKRRKAAEKKAQKEAKKSGRPNEWEGLVEKYIEPMPSDLLSPHELNRRKWLSDVPLVCPSPPPPACLVTRPIRRGFLGT